MFDTIWYDALAKPYFTPPSDVFAPVWIILYITILVSLVIFTVTKTRRNKFKGYIYFLIQLLLNIAWTPVFFSLENIFLALIIIVLLDIFVFFTIKEFHKISQIAAGTLIPYFIWIIYATYLNVGILVLN